MLALWRLWHQFQLFLVLQIRLLLNWWRFCFLLLILAIWLIASAWDSNDWTKARLRDGKYDILEGFFFIWRRYSPFRDIFSLFGGDLLPFGMFFFYLEDIYPFLGYFSLFGGYMLLFGIFSSYLEEICSFWGYFFFIWRWYMLSDKRNWDLPSAKKPGWKCTSASKIALEGELGENLVGFIKDWSCLGIWSCAET